MVFQLRSHTLNFRFLMSPHRKNSVNDKVIGEKWIYLKRKAFHKRVWAISEAEGSRRVWSCQFL